MLLSAWSCSRATATALLPEMIWPDFARRAGDDNSGESPAHRFIETISMASKPLVAAVQGNAVGIGTTMLLHCDLVYLAENARLITPLRQSRACPRSSFELAVALADRARARLRHVCAGRADGGGRSGCVRPGQCRGAAGRTSQEGT